MRLETVLRRKLHPSLSLRGCVAYICVLPWCLKASVNT